MAAIPILQTWIQVCKFTAFICALSAPKIVLIPQIQKLDGTNFFEGVKLYGQELH